jgi:hypothetical protein
MFLFFGLIIFSSCIHRTAEKEVKDLTKLTNFEIHDYVSDSVFYFIENIILWETDKRRNGIAISPDEIGIQINLTIINETSNRLKFYIREQDDLCTSFIYCFIEGKSNDSIIFVNHFVDNTFIVEEKNKYKITLSSDFFNFESLFSSKEDYTSDMVDLLDSIYFKFSPCDSSSFIDDKVTIVPKQIVRFSPSKKTKVFSKNTKGKISINWH